MRVAGRERGPTWIGMGAGMTLLIYVVFDRLLAIPWPASLLGDWLPALKVIPSV